MSSTFEFRSADGTLLRGWRSSDPGAGDGVPVVISNGLGAVPAAWPGLASGADGFRAWSWYHRGVLGSQRPADPSRVRVEDHVDDLVALMDSEGLERPLVACWSIGVNVAFELAQRHPDRVAGLLAVAGVPGGTFATMGGPLRIPKPLRKPIATGAARALRAVGPVLTPVAARVPVTPAAWLARHSGFMHRSARPDVLAPMLDEFLRQDWRWYMELAVAASEHRPMDLSFVRCPVTLLAGERDVLTSLDDVVATASRIPHAQITVLPGSHFLPLEHPELVNAALRDLARRCGLAADA